jgi:hypothetical protein
MDTEAFVRWALDDARTVEERYTVELLIESAMHQWHYRHKTGYHEPWQLISERKRQRDLNPAYDPRYSEVDVRRASEVLAERKSWNYTSFSDRPVRDLSALRFLTALEDLVLGGAEVADLAPLTALPALRVLGFDSKTCEDFRPLARCRQLRELELGLRVPWPELSGLETLDQLEKLTLGGNLLAFAPGLTWPKVRRGSLACSPLAARSVRDLPHLPACEFLTLGGVERLDGIEDMPRLRNLKLTGPVRDFAPLAALSELTWLHFHGTQPLDVSALARLPKLEFVSFHQDTYSMDKSSPRDYAPLAEAPALRELRVTGCPPVETEVAAINATLPSWQERFLAQEPRPTPSLRMVVAPLEKHPRHPETHRSPGEPELIDTGLRECEERWVPRFIARRISEALGHSDWGSTRCYATARSAGVDIESFGVVEKFTTIVEAIRSALVWLRDEYHVTVMIVLKAPRPQATPAQEQLEEQFRREQDEADFENRTRERREYLERLHRYELKKQSGEQIAPKEFAPPPPQPLPPAPWDREGEEEEEFSTGDIAVKKKPDPPPSWFDDEHPLADNYRLMATLTLSEIWFAPHHRDLAVYLMGREPDRVIEDKES